jgi:hypothetical protein
MKKRNPGGSSLGYYWESEDSVVDVLREHVVPLERASRGEIYQVEVDHSAPLSEVAEDVDEEAIDASSATKPVASTRKRPAKKAAAPVKE